MNKIFTFIFSALLFVAFYPVNGFSQCTPDPQFTSPGYYPDTLQWATLGQPYTQTLTAVVPQDTNHPVFGSVPIDSLVIESISNLPPGFSFSCNPPSCGFPGGSTGCMEVIGNPINAADIGEYNLIVNISAYSASIGILSPLSETINYGTFKITDSTSSAANINSFERKVLTYSVFPNPTMGEVNLKVQSPKVQVAQIAVYNVIGEKVKEEQLTLSVGENIIAFSNNFSSGIYLLALSTANNQVTKRLIIRK